MTITAAAESMPLLLATRDIERCGSTGHKYSLPAPARYGERADRQIWRVRASEAIVFLWGGDRESAIMSRLQQAIRDAQGTACVVSAREQWATAALIADTFPLERAPRFPREIRRVGHYARLALVDTALTDREHLAVLSVAATKPWGPAAVLCTLVAFLAWAPRWARWLSLGAICAWLATNDQFARTLVLQRELRRVAPDALLVSDFVTREPGRASEWAVEMFDALGSRATVAAILPGVSDTRRYRARERLYITRFGFRVVTRVHVRDADFTILLRDPPQRRDPEPPEPPGISRQRRAWSR